MNRHDRRAARRRHGCYAAYQSCEFRPAAHAPADCDGSCHTNPVTSDDELLGRPDVRLRILGRVIAMMPSPNDSTSGEGWSLVLLLALAAAALTDQAVARAKALAPILIRIYNRDSAWARLRPVLAASGALRSPDAHAPPVAELLTLCCVGSPGPPAGVAALEAPVFSP